MMACDDTDLEKGIMGGSHWVKRWAEGDIHDFHRDAVDPLFESYGDKMFGGKKKRIFVPLCGKSPDLTWMYEQGHSVVGVEIAEQPCRELFTDLKLQYSVEVNGNVKLYKSEDQRLQLYAADLFELTAESIGTYDMIWDSRSLISINKHDQRKYCSLMQELMKPHCEIYLKAMEYDESVWPGPPHNISVQLVKDLYGDLCSVETLLEKARPRAKVPERSDIGNTDTGNTGSGQPSQARLDKKPATLSEAMKLASFITDRFLLITKK